MALFPRLYVMMAIAALLFGLGAGTVYYWMADKLAGLRAERDVLSQALEQANRQRKADQAMLARRAAANAAAGRETASLRLRLDAALRVRREWSDQPVPPEVRDALK